MRIMRADICAHTYIKFVMAAWQNSNRSGASRALAALTTRSRATIWQLVYTGAQQTRGQGVNSHHLKRVCVRLSRLQVNLNVYMKQSEHAVTNQHIC